MKLKASIVLVLAFLLLPCVAHAQTHPCDTAQPTTGTKLTSVAVTLQVCLPSGIPATTNWILYDAAGTAAPVRSAQTFVAGSVSPVSGKQLYTFAFVTPAAAGVRTYQVAYLGPDGTESPKSDPFVLTVNAPLVLTKPTNLTAQ